MMKPLLILLTWLASTACTLAAQAAEPPKPAEQVKPATDNKAAIDPRTAAPPKPAVDSKGAIDNQDIRAQLMPRRFTTVAAEIGAKINQLPVTEGSAFAVGQVLVVFDCSVQLAQLDKARAELEAAQATLSANSRLDDLGSIGKLEVELSRSSVSRTQAEVNTVKAMLAKCDVTAPFAGRVAEQKVREQQYVQPGQALLDILDDSVLEMEFLVPSRWLTWMRAGNRFAVLIDETGQNYPARILRIGARVDPVSQSIKVTAAIDGQFKALMAGMSGRVALAPPVRP